MRLLSAYSVVLPSLYNAAGAVDLRTLMDGVRRAVSDDSSDSSSSSLASSQLRIDLLRLVAATGIPAKQLLRTVCDDLHFNAVIMAHYGSRAISGLSVHLTASPWLIEPVQQAACQLHFVCYLQVELH